MNITQIKSQLGYSHLNISRDLDENNVPQPWVSHWDNDKRVRVCMHEDVFTSIMADKSFDKLAIKTSVVVATPERAEYTRHVLITPKQLLATL